MLRAALLVLLSVPVLAQGITRVPFPADGPTRDPARMVFTADGVLWAASRTDGVLDRIVAPGGPSTAFPLPFWGGTSDLTVGPDDAVWLAARHYVARHDPATGALRRWTQYRDAWFIETGSDGNLWFIHRPAWNDDPRLVRLTPAGAELSSFRVHGTITGAAFGADGAMWIARSEGAAASLVRIDAQGATRTIPVDFAGALFAAPGFLWLTSPAKIVRVGYDGTILASYPLAMKALGVDDSDGTLWLRARMDLGEEVGRLTAQDVLTRFGPIEPLPSGNCPHTRPEYGGLDIAPDGRVAMADFYPLYGYAPEDPCTRERLENAQNTLTILDPSVAPIIEVRSLSSRVRRRAGRS